MLALASKHGGQLPAIGDMAFALRMDEATCGTVVDRLRNAGLIDRRSGGVDGFYHAPHGWDKRQFKSDGSTDRVQRFRKRSQTVRETAPDTDTDTELDTIAKAMDGKPPAVLQQPLPDPSIEATPAVEPVDLKAVLFSTGVPYLVRHNVQDRHARSMIGKWRQQYGDGAVIDALAAAQSEAASDPIPMINRILETRRGTSRKGTVSFAAANQQSYQDRRSPDPALAASQSFVARANQAEADRLARLGACTG